FLTHFQGLPEFADTFAANNATLLVSISQVAEALCILLIPFFLKRYGIKTVMLIAMFAWVGRFGFLGLGDPGFPGVILFILSCLVYGVAFDFFNVSGGLFVDQECDAKVRASAQGLFMLMTNGLGATIGTLIAGQVVNHYCSWQEVVINGKTTSLLIGEWSTPWFIFAAYALVVAVSFMLVFKDSKQSRTA
ncbi:MAG: MFS transporter, partial [Candidatus Limisoma sp.]